MPFTSELTTQKRPLPTLTKPRVILDALGLPGSVVPSTARNGMSTVLNEVVLEAEMVAFSDATERIDGK